jgi:hypothetical protein
MDTRKRIMIGGVVLAVIILIVLLWVALTPKPEPTAETPSPEPTTALPAEPFGDSGPLPQEALDAIQESNRRNSPTTYLASRLPIVQPTFTMDVYADYGRKSYVFTVTPKTTSLQQVQQDVLDWLLSIGLEESQIESLIIEYKQEVN